MAISKEAQHFAYSILGDIWQIYKVHESDNVIMNENAEAETNLDSREMYFKDVNLDAVIHELTHVYFRATYLRFTSDMSFNDFEEVAVALFADRGALILKQATEIYNKLKEL